MPDDGENSTVATRLRQRQAELQLTVSAMAERCGLPKRSLENYMSLTNPQRPGLAALVAIADGLDVSVDWLIGRAADSMLRNMSRKALTLVCFNAVLRAVAERLRTGNFEQNYQIAAAAMLEFYDEMEQRNSDSETSAKFNSGAASLLADVEAEAAMNRGPSGSHAGR